jgi:hypothetical protein
MSAEACKQELLSSRLMGAHRLIFNLDAHMEEEQRVKEQAALERKRQAIEKEFTAFVQHPLIDEFMAQFEGPSAKPLARYKCLLLRGETRSGKSERAKSLFGSDRTLSVNAQVKDGSLPCIKQFSRSRHAAILWDEIEEKQVLNNKLCFQSGLQMVALGQSACNAYAYEVMLHGVAMLLCSNNFSMTHSDGKPLPPEDAEWLAGNIIEVGLAKDVKWYVEKKEGGESSKRRCA